MRRRWSTSSWSDRPPAESGRAKLVLEYDGSPFFGWAEQPGRPTVEGELRAALRTTLRRDVSLVVAGRTDRGVHALGQVVSYEGPPPSLRSVNGLLPRQIAVVSADEAPHGFNARYDAVSRTYRYRLHTRAARSPFEHDRALWWPWPLDRVALDACAAALVGEHDFRAFTPTETRHRHFRRTVRRAAWDGDDLVIEADAFLRGMIRVLVGTMLERSTTVEGFVALLDGAPRSSAGRTAPAHGLYLESVRYAG